MKLFLACLVLITSFASHSIEAQKAKIIFRNLGKREQGYFYLQGGLVYESRKDIQGFLVFFNNNKTVAYYPVEVDFTSWGLTAHLALVEHDNSIRIEGVKNKSVREFLGNYYGGKAGLSIMAGFKGAVAGRKNGPYIYDSSLKLSTLGLDLSFIKYSVSEDKTYEKELPYSWDEIIK